MEDKTPVAIKEEIVLQKFEGEPLPENEFERIHILNGKITHIEKIEAGVVVSTEHVGEV